MLRVLFDKKRHLIDCQVQTAEDEGWDQVSNGELINCAEQAGYQVHADVRSKYLIPAEPDASVYFAARPRVKHLAQREAKDCGDNSSVEASVAGLIRIHRNRPTAEAASGERSLDLDKPRREMELRAGDRAPSQASIRA